MKTQDNSTDKSEDETFLRLAISLAKKGMANNDGGPFGAVIVKNGEVLAEAWNTVTSSNDPTAHAEVNVIRKACAKLSNFQLDGCTLYTSCEPCPMCLGAIYWARPDRIVFACQREDAAAIDFDDQFIYEEIEKSVLQRSIPTEQLLQEEGLSAFDAWRAKADRVEY